MIEQIVRGPLLIPREDGSITFHHDGVLVSDIDGSIRFSGEWNALQNHLAIDTRLVRASDGVMIPPLLDIHIHIPQNPIRGRFAEGVPENTPGGRLLAGLRRNVFPAEAKCAAVEYARQVIEKFQADTLSHGIVGGAAYMTTSAGATEAALEILPASWSVGMVLMNQNCPENLRTDEIEFEDDMERMAGRFGKRLIMTDRFAVAVNSVLRRRASQLAGKLGLRTQTHLNEQTAEKKFVEQDLYPNSRSYTDVYLRDGLLDHRCILAHCVHNSPEEWETVLSTGSVIAHCPTSNLLLGSGLMPLNEVLERKIPYAIGTDVGASPTVSMLAEMGRFMQVHEGKSSRATATEALWRSTLGPARILGLEENFGRLEPGRPMSFIEVEALNFARDASVEDVIHSILPGDLDNPPQVVSRVTVYGKTVFQRSAANA